MIFKRSFPLKSFWFLIWENICKIEYLTLAVYSSFLFLRIQFSSFSPFVFWSNCNFCLVDSSSQAKEWTRAFPKITKEREKCIVSDSLYVNFFYRLHLHLCFIHSLSSIICLKFFSDWLSVEIQMWIKIELDCDFVFVGKKSRVGYYHVKRFLKIQNENEMKKRKINSWWNYV